MPQFSDFGHLVSLSDGTRHEKVPTADGGDGKWHKIYRQALSDSCGPTCVRMVIEMATGKKVGEDYCRGLTALSELSIDAADQSPLANATESAHDFTATGLNPGHVLKAMKDMKVDAWQAPKAGVNYRVELAKTSLKTPAIVGYFWFNNVTKLYRGAGGHYVVVAGPLPNNPNRLLVLDPGFGIQHIELTDAKSAERYYPRQAGKPAGQQLSRGKLDRADVYFTHKRS